MGADIDLLVKGMNKVSNFEIDIEFIIDMIKENKELISKLEIFIIKRLGIKKYTETEVKIKLNLSELKNDILASKFEETNDEIYNKVIEYRRLDSIRKSIENILKNSILSVSLDGNIYDSVVYNSKIKLKDVENAYIMPSFTKNNKDMVSVAKPSLNYLSIETIKQITQFNKSKSFNSLEEIIYFLRKFNVVIRKSQGESSYLIKGLILYFNISKTTPNYVIEEFRKIYKKKFLHELDELNIYEINKKVLLNTESINEKNYECFKEAWEKCRCKLVLTIELIKAGQCDFSNIRSCYYDKSTRDIAINKEFTDRRNYEEKLILLMNELRSFDIDADKYKVELTGIIKGFRELELTVDEEIKNNDEKYKQKNIEATAKEAKIKEEEKKYIGYYNTKMQNKNPQNKS